MWKKPLKTREIFKLSELVIFEKEIRLNSLCLIAQLVPKLKKTNAAVEKTSTNAQRAKPTALSIYNP